MYNESVWQCSQEVGQASFPLPAAYLYGTLELQWRSCFQIDPGANAATVLLHLRRCVQCLAVSRQATSSFGVFRSNFRLF